MPADPVRQLLHRRDAIRQVSASALTCLAALGLASSPRWARATLPELRLFAGHLPPYSRSPEGWFDAQVAALAKAAHFRSAPSPMPWVRAYMQARECGHALIYPLGRTPERESSWRWVKQLGVDDCVLWVRRDAAPEADAADLGALRRLRVGALRDSVHEAWLIGHGFENTEPVVAESHNARKLGLGRIQAWATLSGVARHLLTAEGVDTRLLHAPLKRGAVELYLAATLDVEPRLLLPWQAPASPPA